MEKHTDGNILDTNVLVLNKFYTALRVISARRAFVFLAKDFAEVIHKNNGRFETYRFDHWIEESRTNGRASTDYVHTPSLQIMVPRVIRLLEYGKMPRRELKFNRKNILARDNYQCQYCGATAPAAARSPAFGEARPSGREGRRSDGGESRPNRGGKKYPLSSMTIDHIIPRSRGGTTEWTNAVTCCSKCNTKKGGRLPKEAGMKLIANPQVPKFNHSISRMLEDKRYVFWKDFIKDLSEVS
ncbi:MAG TPA: HNH endonuclease [Planctomycetota bacterium]|nr:HNH endonuclease [Planctomycetota bacterium]